MEKKLNKNKEIAKTENKKVTSRNKKVPQQNKKPDSCELPKLPRGQGSMKWFNENTIMYRKYVSTGKGNTQVSVFGKTPTEVLKLMRAKELELAQKYVKDDSKTLEDALGEWIELRALSMKASSYDRLEITYRNQVCGHPIASMRYQQITQDDVDRHLKTLIYTEHKSWSTVKKCYDLLNGFFTQAVKRKRLESNPMEFMKMPTAGQIDRPAKNICYLTEDEIHIFVAEATRMIDSDMPAYNWGKPAVGSKQSQVPAYRYGWAFVFVIYTGLRIGELCALRWSDIDFKEKTVRVTKNVHDVKNREYDYSDPERMKLKGVKRYKIVEGTTKTEATRLIPLNRKALEAITEYKKYCKNTAPDDYVITTKYGNCNNLHNMYRRLNDILRNAGIQKDDGAHGTHMLRHTCASLLFKKGLQVEVIAKILGNSPEVCRKTYVHFCQEQEANAIRKIEAFEID